MATSQQQQIRSAISAYFTPLLLSVIGYLIHSDVSEIKQDVKELQQSKDTIIGIKQRVNDLERRVNDIEHRVNDIEGHSRGASRMPAKHEETFIWRSKKPTYNA